jgi:hypothetical protein
LPSKTAMWKAPCFSTLEASIALVILMLDETDGSLDDTTGQRGGRPPMTFFAPDVAGGGTAVNKSD